MPNAWKEQSAAVRQKIKSKVIPELVEYGYNQADAEQQEVELLVELVNHERACRRREHLAGVEEIYAKYPWLRTKRSA